MISGRAPNRRATPFRPLGMAQNEAVKAFRSLWLDLHDQLMALECLTPMLLSLRDNKIIDRAMERRMMKSDRRDGDVDELLMAIETKLTFSPESLELIAEALRKMETLDNLAARLERPEKSDTDQGLALSFEETIIR